MKRLNLFTQKEFKILNIHDAEFYLQHRTQLLASQLIDEPYCLLLDRCSTFWQIFEWRRELGPLTELKVMLSDEKIPVIFDNNNNTWLRLASSPHRLNYALEHLNQKGPLNIPLNISEMQWD